MNKERELDKNGIPVLNNSDNCKYIQINDEDALKVGILLVENKIPNRIHSTSKEAFCEHLADSGLRAVFKHSNEDDMSKEELQEQSELIGRAHRVQVGNTLYKHFDSYIDYGLITDIVTDIYFEDISVAERVEVDENLPSALDLANKYTTEFNTNLKQEMKLNGK